MDRRPRDPRQLAGEYGSSEHGEESFDAGELSREWLFNIDADAIRSGMAFDDVADPDGAASDVAFKPKCLGIYSSIYINFATAKRSPQVQAEHIGTAQFKGFIGLTITKRGSLRGALR
jgi:hypothetical protein